MTETKKWYTSSTVWGAIVTVGAAVGGFFGYGLDAAAQEGLVNSILAVATAIGGIISLFGRIVADKKIG